MANFRNITLNGKPLDDFLAVQQRREIEVHVASEVAKLRRSLPRGRRTPVRLVASRVGRRPTEIHPWVVAEIKALSTDQSLTIVDIAVRAGQSVKVVRLCLRQEGIKRKRGRKKSISLQETMSVSPSASNQAAGD